MQNGKTEETTPLGEFDYVIVGAGSAGCVLANRLSEDPKARVCLFEAGPQDTSPLIHTPIGFAFHGKKAPVNWRFDTTPQKHLNDRICYQPRGRVLGGSRSINAMIYIRGTPSDYDGWARLGLPISRRARIRSEEKTPITGRRAHYAFPISATEIRCLRRFWKLGANCSCR